jgi:hypothetical protein
MPPRTSPQTGGSQSSTREECSSKAPIEDIGAPKSRVVNASSGQDWRWVNPRINDSGICKRIRKIGVQQPQSYDVRGPGQSRTPAIDL